MKINVFFGCDAVQSGRSSPAFWRNLLFQDGDSTGSSETLVTIYQTTWCHIRKGTGIIIRPAQILSTRFPSGLLFSWWHIVCYLSDHLFCHVALHSLLSSLSHSFLCVLATVEDSLCSPHMLTVVHWVFLGCDRNWIFFICRYFNCSLLISTKISLKVSCFLF
jgi:hypothetical protein